MEIKGVQTQSYLPRTSEVKQHSNPPVFPKMENATDFSKNAERVSQVKPTITDNLNIVDSNITYSLTKSITSLNSSNNSSQNNNPSNDRAAQIITAGNQTTFLSTPSNRPPTSASHNVSQSIVPTKQYQMNQDLLLREELNTLFKVDIFA